MLDHLSAEVLTFESISIADNKKEFSLFFTADDEKLSRTFYTNTPFTRIDQNVFENVVFHLGLFCLIDFDQQIVPKKIHIKAGKLSEEQTNFYIEIRNLYARQHFFEKRAPFSLLTTKITSSGKQYACSKMNLAKDKTVAAFGGGKESILYKNLFRQSGVEPFWFVRTRSIFKNTLESIAKSSGLKQYGNLHEDIDLYKNNYVNKSYYSRTNTGISIYIMGMVLYALENGYSNLCFGNERSAVDPYCLWDGEIVNHQMDKTPEFRKAVGDYLKKFIASDLNLFSIFEGMYEYKLAHLIKDFPLETFENMTSCNYMTDEKKWCHKCPKCAWTFAVLSFAFGHESAIGIVGKDLFDDPEIYEDIINPDKRKPFECVGERPEIWLILHQCVEAGIKGKLLDKFNSDYMPHIKNYIDIYSAKYLADYDNPALPKYLEKVFESS